MTLRVGDSAPHFDLRAVQGGSQTRVKLQEFGGKKNVLITFHPVDWTPT
jgi:peroxiredoxin